MKYEVRNFYFLQPQVKNSVCKILEKPHTSVKQPHTSGNLNQPAVEKSIPAVYIADADKLEEKSSKKVNKTPAQDTLKNEIVRLEVEQKSAKIAMNAGLCDKKKVSNLNSELLKKKIRTESFTRKRGSTKKAPRK